jgi:predicted Ser/Thr protein kinase
MASNDKVLDVDIGSDDILYRVLRSSNHIVYIRVTPPSIIPEDKQTYSPDTIRELAKHSPWSQHWTTLTINGHGEHLQYIIDGQTPHRLDVEDLSSRYDRIDVLDLSHGTRLKQRVTEVDLHGTSLILKIARFAFEVKWMSHEARIYAALQDTDLAPRMVALVYEGTPDRITGILLQKFEGKAAESEDLDVVTNSLERLHDVVRHGDLNRWNIIVTRDGPRFVDFEDSEMRPTDDSREFEERLVEEKAKLEEALRDESGAGRPRQSYVDGG